jgi:hypothetical protein
VAEKWSRAENSRAAVRPTGTKGYGQELDLAAKTSRRAGNEVPDALLALTDAGKNEETWSYDGGDSSLAALTGD